MTASKTYDGQLNATGQGTHSALVTGDSVNSAGGQVFLDKNAAFLSFTDELQFAKGFKKPGSDLYKSYHLVYAFIDIIVIVVVEVIIAIVVAIP